MYTHALSLLPYVEPYTEFHRSQQCFQILGLAITETSRNRTNGNSRRIKYSVWWSLRSATLL